MITVVVATGVLSKENHESMPGMAGGAVSHWYPRFTVLATTFLTICADFSHVVIVLLVHLAGVPGVPADAGTPGLPGIVVVVADFLRLLKVSPHYMPHTQALAFA